MKVYILVTCDDQNKLHYTPIRAFDTREKAEAARRKEESKGHWLLYSVRECEVK